MFCSIEALEGKLPGNSPFVVERCRAVVLGTQTRVDATTLADLDRRDAEECRCLAHGSLRSVKAVRLACRMHWRSSLIAVEKRKLDV